MTRSVQPPVEAWHNALQRGLEHLRSGDLERAAVYFERAHRLNPGSPEACYAWGREQLRRGHAEVACDLLRSAWDGDRTLVSAAATLARCLGLSLGRYDEAHAVLDQAALEGQSASHGASSPRPRALHFLDVVRSELHLEQGDFEQARALAQQARTAAPAGSAAATAASAALARVYNHDGLAANERGSPDQALFLFKRAADLDPSWSGPHVNMGGIFTLLEKPGRALQAYRTAVAIEPHDPVALLDYGLLLYQTGVLGDACDVLEHAVECDPATSGVASAFARACIDAGAADRAVAILASTVEAHPSLAELWTQLGVALLADHEVADAEACWRRALDLDPDDRETCARLADLLSREGRYHEAAILAARAQEPE